MKVTIEVTLKRTEGPPWSTDEEVADVLAEEIQSMDFWIDETHYDLSTKAIEVK